MLFESWQQDETPTASINKNPGALGLYIESIRGGKGVTLVKCADRLFIHIRVFKAGIKLVKQLRMALPPYNTTVHSMLEFKN